MNENLLSEEYLSKFPTILCEALKSSDKYRNRFMERVKKEYAPIKVYRGIHKDNTHWDLTPLKKYKLF